MNITILVAFFMIHICFSEASAESTAPAVSQYKHEILSEGHGVIWGFDFLPDGRIIFTERSGKVKIYNPKKTTITELPHDLKVFTSGQGGLLDIRVHPQFKENRWIYVTYAKPVEVGKKREATTAVGRWEFIDDKLTKFTNIFEAKATNDNTIHFGSRIEFAPNNTIFVTVGDRDDRHKAQDRNVHNGKILKMTTEGNDVEIWSLGHRNPQGLVLNATNGVLYSAEFGPRGGDELNKIEKNKNYGWPVITYGREYWGPKIGEGTKKIGMEQPLVHWVPAISPSAMTIYTGNKFKNWQGNIFLGCLSSAHIRRVVLKDDKVVEQEEILKNKMWRFRNLRSGPDGWLYFSTDNGHLGRLIQ